jgi:hypothetical protein
VIVSGKQRGGRLSALSRVRPTTPAGAGVLLAYVHEDIKDGDALWHRSVLANVAGALRGPVAAQQVQDARPAPDPDKADAARALGASLISSDALFAPKSKAQRLFAIAEYKFKIGQAVYFPPKKSKLPANVASGSYQIIRRLPAIDGEFQYVIRSAYEDHSRVASEGELTRV